MIGNCSNTYPNWNYRIAVNRRVPAQTVPLHIPCSIFIRRKSEIENFKAIIKFDVKENVMRVWKLPNSNCRWNVAVFAISKWKWLACFFCVCSSCWCFQAATQIQMSHTQSTERTHTKNYTWVKFMPKNSGKRKEWE